LRNAYAFHRPVANSYLVRERDRRLARELALVLLVVLLLGGGLLAYTWIHLEALRTGYRIDLLERQLRDLAQVERQLQLEASYLASPQRIEERAVRELGMQQPVLEQVVFWDEAGRPGRDAVAPDGSAGRPAGSPGR
jgi:cell division protein FtsL